mmetsp:Transcript_2967/g.5349  ORF Transcript_2967/g.5349 Transcript_2967/m.5349 type:complete len:806 (-) Transcript_2967:111-2528(-)
MELCSWLETEELVINGQLSPKAAGLDLSGLVPPNLQTMVQATVDQLALVPRVVLNCAAVLGNQFAVVPLLGMMPERIVQCEEELQAQLEELHDAHLIQRPARVSQNVGLTSTDYWDSWKFCSSLHHEVVYSSMAHTHRRSLHLKAARAIEARLESVNSVLESRPLLNALTIHLLRSCRTSGRSSQGQRFREMKKSEVDWLFDALTRAAENSQAVGDYEEAVQYLTELITVLREQNEMADELEFNLLEAESLAVEALNKCFLTMTLFTVSTTPTPSSTETLQQKLAELAARQKELQEKIKKARGSVVEVNGRNNRKKLSGFSLARRLSVAAKFTSAGLEFVTNKGFMQPETCRRILNEMRSVAPSKERLNIASNACGALLNQASCWERISLGETGHMAFEDAGLPWERTNMFGTPSVFPVMALWLSGQLWSGQLGGTAEVAARRALEKMDSAHVGVLVLYWECCEASWEPLKSKRVQWLQNERLRVGSPKKPYDHVARCMQHLHEGEAAMESLGPSLFITDDARTDATLAYFSAFLNSAVDSSCSSLASGLHVAQPCVVRMCVAEGCRVVFPSEAAPSVPAALEHLTTVTESLSTCLAAWARSGVNVFGELAFLPSTMMWGRSMLHLFQWVLREAGLHPDSLEPVHLPEGLAGFPAAAGGMEVVGPAAVASGLLLAQQVGAARGELLPGCLPATVALVRLLLGNSCELLQVELRATRVSFPETAPICSSSVNNATKAAVREVQFGSSEAREVAEAHLTAVLKSVVVADTPLQPNEVTCLGDVAGSESLWEAVELLHQSRHLPDRMT